MRILNLLVLAGLLNFSAGAALADDRGPCTSSSEFVWTAARSAMAEHRLAKMAAFHSSNEGVKVVANKTIKDQEATLDSLRLLAFSKGMKFPQDINYDQQAQIDRLNQLWDNDFDRAFLDETLKDNRSLLSYMDAEQASKDSDIRNWAAQNIPEVNHHIRMAEAIDLRVATLSSSPW